eukprot:3230879-Rhodomonas_salina.1
MYIYTWLPAAVSWRCACVWPALGGVRAEGRAVSRPWTRCCCCWTPRSTCHVPHQSRHVTSRPISSYNHIRSRHASSYSHDRSRTVRMTDEKEPARHHGKERKSTGGTRGCTRGSCGVG